MITLAWRNLWRQRRRTLLTMLAIAVACVVMIFMLALQLGTYATMKDNTLRVFDGYAQVQAPGYLDDPGIRKSIAHPLELARELRALPGINATSVRTQTYALLSHDRRSVGVFLVGVQPGAEAKVSKIAGMLKHGRFLDSDHQAAVVVGVALARNLHVKVGDMVTLLGSSRDGSVAADRLRIAGIVDSGIGQLDRQLAEMPLARFQDDFSMPQQAHMIVLSGARLADVDAALPKARALAERHGLAVRSWGQLQPGLKHAIQLDASTSTLWYVSLVVVAIALLLNTLLMSVLERTREFGMLLALGMRPGGIGRMVWLEILLLLAMGLSIGIAAGAALTGWYAVHGMTLPGTENVFAQWGLPAQLYPRLDAWSLLAGPAAIAACTALAGLFPYLRIRRLQPVTAMRAV
jgi:ABC-type lipoprotein release transport system permease subunit